METTIKASLGSHKIELSVERAKKVIELQKIFLKERRKKNLNNLINLRGMREQAFRYAAGKKHGGMKNCYTRGCQIFTPLFHALKGEDITVAITIEKMYNGEVEIDYNVFNNK